ncbi:hypothetical protein ACIBHX_52165 [Nonomuraea sp. NPDC050536]|uniref:hypothetical protein n=1 Tax=Nonomuraea sp. NPDC050536 TaxID=3364366 RepID=UPI0037CBBFBD
MTVRARIAAAWGWHSRWIDAHPVLAPPASGIALFCVGVLASWAAGEDPTPWGHRVRSAAAHRKQRGSRGDRYSYQIAIERA